MHSGRASASFSGFNGPGGWDKDPDLLTSRYYKEVLKFDQFELVFQPANQQYMWQERGGGDKIFMLQADMALVFDLEKHLNPSNGKINCTLQAKRFRGQTQCLPSSLRARAQLYRDNNLRWITDFEAALLKMVNTGCGNGKCTAL
jgi:hypothetical protein